MKYFVLALLLVTTAPAQVVLETETFVTISKDAVNNEIKLLEQTQALLFRARVLLYLKLRDEGLSIEEARQATEIYQTQAIVVADRLAYWRNLL